MNVFGLHVDLLLFFQFLVTVAVITVYSLLTSMREARSNLLSRSHIGLLISFLLANQSKFKSVIEVAAAQDKDAQDSNNELPDVVRMVERINSSGNLPGIEQIGGSNLFENVVIMLLAPLLAPILSIFYLSESIQYKLHRIVDTEWRKDKISKFAIMLSVNVVVLAIIGIFVLSRSVIWGSILLSVVGLSTVSSLVVMSVIVWEQGSWKEFWQMRMLEVMATAGQQNDHDLFNRAMILKSYVESQPDVPIPGNLGFYGVLYSIIQGILLLLSTYL